ncbi:Glycosyltransferase [Candidatus Burkholderia verschuerenii]|uniref:Glycosyltransferase n=1 Tax=Candidatus Burkholderia verschuerenii TaxID=242163 RepID=A0A0L0MET1_9BURK|nr:glycosyltransferase [Candidatus Burkholderia verschuerenii]KND60811.1 Glycosyltransferase [Candidatus Burkholderia verschuerenii]
MKILHLLSTVDPRAGGPTEGVLQSGLSMRAMGHEIEVVSLDAPYVAAFPLRLHALGPSKGFYGLCPALVPWLNDHAARFDAVIVNGLWQYQSYGAWKALRNSNVPYYVFPHGMLDPWFKRTYPLKHLKKCLYWPWAEYRVLRDAKRVLFTTQEEKLLARQSFKLYRANEEVVAFGTRQPPDDSPALRDAFLSKFPHLADKRSILFLGRIHEKKGCDLLIKAFAAVRDLDPNAHLVMAGPDDSDYAIQLRALSKELGIADRMTWTGMLTGEEKWGAFRVSDVFALPSHQENFGIAVAEALGLRMPVLISDKVNIWREVKDDRAGIVTTDTVEGATDALSAWLKMDAAAREAMREQALQTFMKRFHVDAMSKDLLRVLCETGGTTRGDAFARGPMAASLKR